MKQKLNLRFLMTLLIGVFVSVSAFAQNITVKGNVKDTTGEPVFSAAVKVKGTGTGCVTDLNGNFTLSVARNAVLEISFMGYKTQEVKAAPSLIVILQDDNRLLNEQMVIGYAKVKKSDMTGSVAAIKPDEMSKGITTSAQDMLTGKIAGVSVISDGGTPGGGASIRIRGGSSLSASNDPLIVIDGLAMDNNGVQGLANPLSMVNPEDIESMSVLKDASATAIYGSRASNGVIIITTKKGKKGSAPKVNYNGNVSIASPRKTYDLLSGNEFRAYAATLGFSDAVLGTLGTANTDWQDEIYRTAVSTDHQVSVAGATKNLPYRVSVGYTDNNGIAKTSNYQRFTGSLNLSPTFLDDHLSVNFNAKYMYAHNRYVDGGVFGAAIDQDPTQPVYADQYATGGYWQITTGDFSKAGWANPITNTNTPQNPYALIKNMYDRANVNSLIGNLEVDYKIHGFEDLRIHASVGADYSEGRQLTDVSPYSYSNNYYGWTGVRQSYKYNLQGNIYADYSHNFDDVHNVDFMIGTEEQHFNRKTYNYGGGNYLGDVLVTDASAYYSPTLRSEQEHEYTNTLVSYFARLNYGLLDKYLLTATIRNDNSSRFAKGHRAGWFPSVALAWKINQENFLKDVSALDELKLRLNWGITGQQNIGNDFYYLPRYVASDQYARYSLGQETYYTIRPEVYNPNLKWEKTATWGAGLDYSFLNGRVEGSIDYYYRKTSDLISTVSVASGTNFGNYLTKNIGDLSNHGIEFNINARPVVTKDFSWTISYNVGWNKNKITHLEGTGGNDYFLTGNTISPGLSNQVMVNKVGYAANSFYVYQQVYDADGNPIEGQFVDRNGNGQIDPDDKYVYKHAAGDVLMGMTNKFIWKNWDFSFTMRASFNNYLYYDFLANKANGSNRYANSAWNNTSPEAVKLGFEGKTDYYMSDYFIRNASFLRVDNITLGYSFNGLGATGKYNGIGGRVYVLVQNPFVFTKYKGLDPEVSMNHAGVDNGIYPRPTTYMLGLSLNF